MTAPAAGTAGAAGAPPSWHDDALRLGAALDHVAAALVVGRDGEAAAWAALGAARAQSARRRVAVADLVGDAAALAELGEGDEPVGLSDSFFYGVTLNKIARPVDAAGTLFVLPSGSEPVAVAEVLSSDRWRRLVAGFRDAGALLVLAAQADAPGLDVLASYVDGLVVVGDLGGLLPDAPAPIMVIPSPTPRARAARAAEPARPAAPVATADDGAPAPFADELARATAPRAAAAGPADVDRADPSPATGPRVVASAAPVSPDVADAVRPSPAAPRPAVTPPAPPEPPAAPRPDRRRAALLAGAALAAAVAAALAWTQFGRPAREPGRGAVDAAPAAAATPAPQQRDSANGAGPVQPPPAANPADLAAVLAVHNPADSARAAVYAVHLVSAGTPEAAALPGDVDPAAVPDAALTPQLENGQPWWRLLAGGYPTRERAEAAVAALRASGVLGANAGAVVRAPYTLLVAEAVPAARAPDRVAELSRRGVPTYTLPRGGGTVALYAGAFERPADAAYLAQALQAAGVTPALVYRTAVAAAGEGR